MAALSSSSPPKLIFKILHRDEWTQAQKDSGIFRGSAIDLQDGFIHFSTAGQSVETAAKWFSGQSDLLLVAVETATLADALRWEPSRDGDLFPHLYAPFLSCNVARWVKELPLGADGRHIFPDLAE